MKSIILIALAGFALQLSAQIPAEIVNNERRLNQYLQRFTPAQQAVIRQQVAAQRAASAQPVQPATKEDVNAAVQQAMDDQRIYREAMRARAAGRPYYVDPATARRIFK